VKSNPCLFTLYHRSKFLVFSGMLVIVLTIVYSYETITIETGTAWNDQRL
jgi:hypothetical protein